MTCPQVGLRALRTESTFLFKRFCTSGSIRTSRGGRYVVRRPEAFRIFICFFRSLFGQLDETSLNWTSRTRGSGLLGFSASVLRFVRFGSKSSKRGKEEKNMTTLAWPTATGSLTVCTASSWSRVVCAAPCDSRYSAPYSLRTVA